ncbi:MAG: signal peptidase I [Oscillospiraceae bacterium]|nr:signal peptidase I [Oscillospiraceae bacterium]MBQ5323338.1 signal peptidase I [Oscillospiraceae bacterium]
MEENKLENEVMELEEEISAPEKKKKSAKEEILDWAKTLILYCVLPLAIFQTFCFMASVPTGSMETTIPVGAQVVTTRIFNKDNINHGDIIVFNSDELGVVLIKRCIGLPGDSVYFDGTGDVYVNGALLKEPYVSSWSDFEGEFTVPEDCYFFLGDNRAGSHDARFWDEPYIHKSEVKGKARFVLFPFSNFGILE